MSGLGGGAIESTGWDYGQVSEDSFIDYFFQDQLAGGGEFKATLNWFVGRTYARVPNSTNFIAGDDYFTDLALELHLMDNGSSILVAQSDAKYLNTEHLSFNLLSSGSYFLRVNWVGELYDFQGNSEQNYGIAWNAVSAVPEPSTWMMLAVGLVVLSRRKTTQ